MKTIMAGVGLTAASIAIAISASPNHPMQPTRAPLQPIQQTVQPAQPLQTTVSRDPECRWGIDCPMETWPPAKVETPHQHPQQGPDCRDVVFGKSICDTVEPTAPTLDPGIIHDRVV